MITYRDVAVCKTWVGSIENMRNLALALGYEYFLWNDRVYQIEVGGGNYARDTGLTKKELDDTLPK